jgi:hypothetical protein
LHTYETQRVGKRTGTTESEAPAEEAKGSWMGAVKAALIPLYLLSIVKVSIALRKLEEEYIYVSFWVFHAKVSCDKRIIPL